MEDSSLTTAYISVAIAVLVGIAGILKKVLSSTANGIAVLIDQFFTSKEKLMELDEKKKTLEIKNQIEEIKSEKKIEEAEVYRIVKMIREIREVADARNVIISAFHNGVSAGFKNYSRRYESSRSVKLDTLYQHQTRPLDPYIESLKQFEKKYYIEYNVSQKYGPDAERRIANMKRLKVKQCFIFPILVDPDKVDDMQGFDKLPIYRNGVKYLLIGSLLVFCDKPIKLDDKEAFLDLCLSYAEDISKICTKNQGTLV